MLPLRLLPLTDERLLLDEELLLAEELRRLVARLLLTLDEPLPVEEETLLLLGRPELPLPALTVPLGRPLLGAVPTSLLEPLMRSA